MASTASSIASSGEAKWRLEDLGQSCASVVEVLAQSDAEQDEPRESERALEDREEDRRRGSGSGSPSAMNSSGDACRCAEVQREIATTSKHLRQRRKKEAREGVSGYL
jgi:hypothetical protein